MDFDVIKKANLNSQQNILKGFSDADDVLEKAKAVPIGTRVERKSGIIEEKTANGWVRVKKDKSPKSEEQSNDKYVKVNPETSVNVTKDFEKPASNPNAHPYESTRNSMSHEQLSQKVTEIVRGSGSKKGKILEMYKLGLSNDEIVNYSGAKLSDVKWYTKEYQKNLTSGAQQSTQSSQNTRTQNNRSDSSQSSSDDNQNNLLVDYEELPEISTQDRWNSYELFGKMMCLGAGKSMIAYGSGGVGKGVLHGSKIITPKGFKFIEDIIVGDEVISDEGKVCKVLGVYPQGLRNVFEIIFKDGSVSFVDNTHLWRVYDSGTSKKEWQVLSTQQLLDEGLEHKRIRFFENGKSYKGKRWFIPLTKEVEFEKQKELEIDPYLLGIILGDGCLRNNSVSFSGDKTDINSIKNKIESIVDKNILRYSRGRRNIINVTIIGGNKNDLNCKIHDLLGYKLSIEKEIPEHYLYASTEERKELLRGLLDTDGSIHKGRVSFSSSSKILAEQVRWLCKSLGAYVSLKEKKTYRNISYRLSISKLTFNPFYLERKAKIWDEWFNTDTNYIDSLSMPIVSIKQIEDGETTCIKVDSPNSCFLLEDFIVTHNTYTLMGRNQVFDQFKMKEFNEEIHDSFSDGGESIGEDGEPVRMAQGRFLDKSNYDYVKITGKVSASEMFKTLAEHNGKVIIFDDCDSVLKDENAVNVLKGALDTTGDGTISWKVAGDITTEYSNIEGAIKKEDKGKTKFVLPKRFKFKGQVMFISNLEHKQMPQALISRALNVDLTMNADETSERLQQIYPHMDFQDPEGNKIDVSNEDKKAAADFIHKYRHALDTSDLNARTLGKIAMIKKVAEETGSQMDWQKAAVSMLKKRK